MLLATAWNRLVVDQGWNDVVQKALPTFMGVFACGMLAALWIEHAAAATRRILSARATTLLALAGAALVDRARRVDGDDVLARRLAPAVRDLPAAAGFALVIAAVAAGRGPVLRGLAWRPLAGAGIVSYGLYLWHLPVLLAVREAGLLPEPFVPRLPSC